MVLLLVRSLLPVAAALAGATALSASSLAPRPRPRRLGLAAALMRIIIGLLCSASARSAGWRAV